MAVCRACSFLSGDLVLVNEDVLYNFNLLTSLNAQLNDGLPQHICTDCHLTVNQFMCFRDKCITVDAQFRQNCDQKVVVKLEQYEDVKIESQDIFNNDYSFDDNIIYDNVQEDSKHQVESLENNDTEVKAKVKKELQSKGVGRKSKNVYNKRAKLPKLKVKCENSTYACGLCSLEFNDVSSRVEHLEIHKNSRHCALCSQTFQDAAKTLAHRLKHVSGNDSRCYICLKTFRKEIYLEYHYKKVHFNESDPSLKCDQCNHKYEKPRFLQRHIRRSHPIIFNGNVVICDYCKSIFKSKTSLRIHIEKHLNRKPYTCTLCDFASNYKGALNKHNLLKHSEVPFVCKNCSQVYRTGIQLEKHKCKEQSMLVCPVCGKLVDKKNRLDKHMLSHSDVRPFKCNKCPATFKSRTTLKNHTDRHDGIRRYKCEYCPMSFHCANVLIKHRRTHTGEKPYVCEICSKGFTGNHNLKVHMKVHGITNLIVKKNKVEDTDLPKLFTFDSYYSSQ